MWPNILLIIIIIVVYNIVKSKNAEKRKLTEARDELINDVLNEITRNAKNWYCIGVGLDRVYCDYPAGSYEYPSQKFSWGLDSNTVVAYDRRGYPIHVYDFNEHNYVVSITAKEAIANAIAQRLVAKLFTIQLWITTPTRLLEFLSVGQREPTALKFSAINCCLMKKRLLIEKTQSDGYKGII